MSDDAPDERAGTTYVLAPDVEALRRRDALWAETPRGPGDPPLPEQRPDRTVGLAVDRTTVPFALTYAAAFGLIRGLYIRDGERGVEAFFRANGMVPRRNPGDREGGGDLEPEDVLGGDYWARGSEWDELTTIEGADPTFAAFLRCGSARVVVPARPGFELAILHWLIYQEPFFGDPLPLPGRDLYVSVASEIRDLTRPPEDGDAGDCWETRLPTTLMWLEENAELPQNDARRLGRPPHRPTEAYCERGGDDRNDDDDDDHDREPD